MGEPTRKSRVSIMGSKSQTLMGDRSQSQINKSSPALAKFTSRLRMRRSSFGYSGVPGVGRVAERQSMFAPEFKRPPLLYLNTYQLDPIRPFHPPSVIKAAEELLEELFIDHKYNAQIRSTLHTTSMKSMSNMDSKQLSSRTRLHKRSFGFSGVTGIKPPDRTSTTLTGNYKPPPLMYLNTYQLDPYVRFHPPAVQRRAEEVLDEYFTDHKYDHQESPMLAMRISETLLRAIKGMNFNRYRILCVVTIAQKRAQSYYNAVSFLWDHERDNYVDLFREENSVFIQVTVFGIYLD